MLKHGYRYDILPRSWIGRLGIALAAVGGPISIVLLVVLGPTYSYVEGPCGAQEYPDCLDAQTALERESIESCDLPVRTYDVCFAPLGRVSPGLVLRLQEYYVETYPGMRVGILTPKAIPQRIVNEDRMQVDLVALGDLLEEEFPVDARDYEDYPLVIGLTPMDAYYSEENWFWAFGMSTPQSVISTARMDPDSFGDPDDDKLFSRAQKMVTKYIGVRSLYFETSSDPHSQLYNHIRSTYDLDQMSDEPLRVQYSTDDD